MYPYLWVRELPIIVFDIANSSLLLHVHEAGVEKLIPEIPVTSATAGLDPQRGNPVPTFLFPPCPFISSPGFQIATDNSQAIYSTVVLVFQDLRPFIQFPFTFFFFPFPRPNTISGGGGSNLSHYFRQVVSVI
jgi:hypothetical protein